MSNLVVIFRYDWKLKKYFAVFPEKSANNTAAYMQVYTFDDGLFGVHEDYIYKETKTVIEDMEEGSQLWVLFYEIEQELNVSLERRKRLYNKYKIIRHKELYSKI